MKYSFYIYYLRNRSPFALFARLIRFAIKRGYNHVEVVAVPEAPNMPLLFFGAVAPASRRTSYAHIKSNYDVIKATKLINCGKFSDLENIKYLDSLCGRPYSRAQIFLILLGAASFYLKQKLSKSKLNYDHLLICTELAARFMGERMGYVFNTEYDACEFEDLINAEPRGV